MIEGYYVMIAEFLSEVFRPAGVQIVPDPMCIKWAINTLVMNGITKEEIKLAAIREYNVIIRDDLFPGKEENNG